MRALRLFLCWIFAFIAVICGIIDAGSLWPVLHPTHPQSVSLALEGFIVPAIFSIFVIVYGMAWWTVLREKPSARSWGFGASLLHTLVSLFPILIEARIVHVHRSHIPLRDQILFLAVGILGLVVFSYRYQRPDQSAKAHQTIAIPGDGTSKFINKTMWLWGLVLSFVLFSLQTRWDRARGIPIHRSGLHVSLITVVFTAFLLTLLHELGHTTVGLALGMKLRAFVVGPLQFRIQSGRWTFRFEPKAILLGGGATGVVPASASFARWRFLWMTVAGPLANLLTGLLALEIAFRADANSRVQAGGLLELFGVFSLATCALNLIPFRTRANYSDGARIYQLLSAGPWGDFHQVAALVGSSLVTELRPKDYGLRAIERAASGIAMGDQGLLLRLYAHEYYLDWGQLNEAGRTLKEAEKIYCESASGISAELHTSFIFGSAYVLRDAAAARQWWERMEAKKPTRFNVDYWRAKSALFWIDGDIKGANEAWEKSQAEAEKLPHAGAYEFDRYLCEMLRKAIDEVAVTA
jgi:Peptidase family M50